MTDATGAVARPIPAVEVIPASADDLTVLATDRPGFARRMGSPAPSGWPEFPEALGFTIDRLTTHPQESEWWMHFFLVNGLLVGSGGFVGRPRHGAVEIGYEIAPGFRRKHYGTGAAAALVAKAFGTGEVNAVIAHTLPNENPSTKVLDRLGFTNEGEVKDSGQGIVWRWRLTKR
ncbi:MAG TPA: GNAT family protein [Pseudolysinimonas sp.]|nr:GNAT family protein [Pseudolysinimonas sp.]